MAKVKSIQELLEMKQDIDQRRNEIHKVYIPSLDTEVKFKMATRASIIQAQSLEPIEMDQMIIYNHVLEPDLKDKKLQEAYNMGCQPHEIVDKIFEIEEVGTLSFSIVGREKSDIVKEIKNS